MYLRRTLGALSITALLLFVPVATASAATRDFSLTVSPRMSRIAPGDNVAVSWAADNHTWSEATCSLRVRELNWTIFRGTLLGHNGAGGGLSAPPTGKVSKWTFVLRCNDSVVASRSIVAIVVSA